MKKSVKIITLLMALTLAFSMFAGCGKTDDTTTTTPATTTAATLKLKVAMNAEFPPFESLDTSTNEIVGFDVDLIKMIAKKIGAEVEFKNMDFDGVIASIPGVCDIAASGLTINDTRKKSVDFSDPYYNSSQLLIVNSNETAIGGATKEEIDKSLEGKRIGACNGYTGEYYAKGDADWDFEGIKDADVKGYETISLAIQDLKSGKIDAVIMDGSPAKAAASKSTDLKVIDIPLTVEEYGIALEKGNTELKAKIDGALAELIAAGEVEKLVEKWIAS